MARMLSPAARGLAHLAVNRRFARISAFVALILSTIVLLSWSRRDPYDQSSWHSALLNGVARGGSGKRPPAFYPFETTSAFYPVAFDGDLKNKTVKDLCASFPHHLMQRIQPVLKMGHGENQKMVEAQLHSVSACFTNDELLIFSDLEQDSHGRHAIDILANLPQAYRERDPQGKPNPDFDNYEKLSALARANKLTPENDPARGQNGWSLDKYKFLAEVERSWQMRPGRDFYVFYESDTYISWDNMFRFLSTLDPNVPLYMGSPSPGRHDGRTTTWFANGGPGLVLSRGAMEKLLKRQSSSYGQYTDPPFALKWQQLIRDDPCGDSVLGWALWEAGVPLSGMFPMFNTYAAHNIPYTDRMWCQPFITMHKLRIEDMTGLWRWENGNRQLGRPLLYSDIYEFLSPVKPEVRQNWDNTNWDRLAHGRDTYVDTLDACRQACRDSDICLSYHWQGKHSRKCVLMPFVTLGVEKQPEAKNKEGPNGKSVDESITFTSGWLKSRIDRWRGDHVCRSPDWVYPSIERHF
ncbi:beta-1,3-N-acetylglucosaminyltransferase radical fringe [Podospora fimiseda]|uniref:N-acetylgalactosaminide beta-1,3-galactosyltransferase n=1 Tax=Podospora fimiseda TaxID=252190 RepID=A0AAN7GUI7_9PEZI|nr:beta-1,3-N-acetylglucosaminyltransferase radical fringe [Podospora fimiseda]